jgi:hypothetical protein
LNFNAAGKLYKTRNSSGVNFALVSWRNFRLSVADHLRRRDAGILHLQENQMKLKTNAG